jgi:hypothetical protein
MAIGQLLGLAKSAGFRFDVIEGRMAAISANADWGQWPVLKACLDGIGIEAVISYFERNTPERHATLSATA